MEERKNMELNDEMMAKAAGGNGTDIPRPKYEVGDTVELKFSNDEGVITIINRTVTERRANPAGWEYKIRYSANGNTYEHWYPEIAI